MVYSRTKMGLVAIALAAMILVPLFGASEAQAAPITTPLTITGFAVDPTAGLGAAVGHLVSSYDSGGLNSFLTGTVTSDVFYDHTVGFEETWVRYIVTVDAGLNESVDQFKVNDGNQNPPQPLDIVNIVMAGYMTTDAQSVTSIFTKTPGPNAYAFEWNGTLPLGSPDPIASGGSATVFLKYNNIRPWTVFDGDVTNSVSVPSFPVLGVVPEPTTMLLMGIGLVGVARKVRQKRSKKNSDS